MAAVISTRITGARPGRNPKVHCTGAGTTVRLAADGGVDVTFGDGERLYTVALNAEEARMIWAIRPSDVPPA